MNWEVVGADRKTGLDRVIIIDADDEAQARRRANRQGILVEDLRLLDPNDSAAGVAVCPAIPPPAPVGRIAYATPLPRSEVNWLSPTRLIVCGIAGVLGLCALAVVGLKSSRPSPSSSVSITAAMPVKSVAQSPKIEDIVELERTQRRAVRSRSRLKSNLSDGIVLRGLERYASVAGDDQTPDGIPFRVYRLSMPLNVTCTLMLDGPRDGVYEVTILVPVFAPEEMNEQRSLAAATPLVTAFSNTLPTLAHDPKVLGAAIKWAGEHPGKSQFIGDSGDWGATIGSIPLKGGAFITLKMQMN
jgi:hypothetical protein